MLLLVVVLNVTSVQLFGQTSLRSGDLLFVKASGSDFSAAIDAATAVDSLESFDHVAIAYLKDTTLFVIEATPKLGVVCRPYSEFLADCGKQKVVAMRFAGKVDFKLVIDNALKYVGQSYDFYFLPDNDKIYCSELVFLSFTNAKGKPLFSSKPMNFRASDGSMPEYWTKLYQSLGTSIPEGVSGTNPNDMSKDRRLHRLN